MKDSELIARQAMQIEVLIDNLSALQEKVRRAMLHITCIGGPLNDNKMAYSKEQLMIFFRIMDELKD